MFIPHMCHLEINLFVPVVLVWGPLHISNFFFKYFEIVYIASWQSPSWHVACFWSSIVPNCQSMEQYNSGRRICMSLLACWPMGMCILVLEHETKTKQAPFIKNIALHYYKWGNAVQWCRYFTWNYILWHLIYQPLQFQWTCKLM